LKKEDLLTLERFADKSAQNLINSIQKSKEVPFPRVLYALGIRFVGAAVARTIAEHFRSIDKLANATYEELIEINEIGPRIAESILEYFQNPRNLEIIDKLKKAGVKLEMEEETTETVSNDLEDKNIVISGTFNQHSREELKEMIQKHGGKNTSSVSSKTDYLLAGKDIGPKKLEKAKKNGVPIISEEDFLKMIRH
ncbi:MAG: helix-hairpin-helix domain-containing protein, partial [Bacteroidales bacterium]